MNDLTFENESRLIVKYDISINEMYFVKCIIAAKEESPEFVQRYAEIPEKKRGNPRDMIEDLKEKRIIPKDFVLPDNEIGMEIIPFTQQFRNDFYKGGLQLGQELFDAYPHFGSINDKIVPLRGVASKFGSMEAAFREYSRAIHYNTEIHDDIIKLVEWGNKNNIICQSLASFIINRAWNDLKEIKDGLALNFNINAVKLI